MAARRRSKRTASGVNHLLVDVVLEISEDIGVVWIHTDKLLHRVGDLLLLSPHHAIETLAISNAKGKQDASFARNKREKGRRGKP